MQRRYDRYVTIQEKMVTASPSGEQIVDWVILERRRPAFVAPVRGEERFSTPQELATSQVEIKIRYSTNVADLNPGDHRIIYPAFAADEDLEPVVRRVYDILDIAEISPDAGFSIFVKNIVRIQSH